MKISAEVHQKLKLEEFKCTIPQRVPEGSHGQQTAEIPAHHISCNSVCTSYSPKTQRACQRMMNREWGAYLRNGLMFIAAGEQNDATDKQTDGTEGSLTSELSQTQGDENHHVLSLLGII